MDLPLFFKTSGWIYTDAHEKHTAGSKHISFFILVIYAHGQKKMAILVTALPGLFPPDMEITESGETRFFRLFMKGYL